MFKILDEVCTPRRCTKYSAYVDLFAREDVVIGTGETKIIPLGVKIDLDSYAKMHYGESFNLIQTPEWDKNYVDFAHFLKSHYLEVALRSSLAIEGLIIPNGIGIIDLDYPGEIGLILHNPYSLTVTEHRVQGRLCGEVNTIEHIKKPFTINKGNKVAQCTLKEHKGYLMGYESEVVRKGGYGSTGK